MMKKTIEIHLGIVILVYPLLCIALSLTPWSQELFAKNNTDFYFPYWITVILLHWLIFYVTYRFLKKENHTLKDIGYGLTKRETLLFIGFYLLAALIIVGLTEISLNYVPINEGKLAKLDGFFPKTTLQRLLFVVIAFTAGFCEEIVFRGYAVTKLASLGVNKWLALIPAGISFVFIHGVAGFYQFWFYFIPAIILGVIYILSKKLLPGIIIHCAYDLMAIMAIFQATN